MTTVKTYRELIAWQRAMDFAEGVYRETGGFPLEETQILLSGRLGYLSFSAADALLNGAAEVGRLVNGLYASLEAKEERQ